MTVSAHTQSDKPAKVALPCWMLCMAVFASAFSTVSANAGEKTRGDATADAARLPAVAPATAQPPTPCSGLHYREFDFWIGDWQVEAKGKVIADSSITRAQDGCVVHERYQLRGASYQGQSLNIYDASRARWHQTWVDNSGMLLTLEGTWQAGAMVLESSDEAGVLGYAAHSNGNGWCDLQLE